MRSETQQSNVVIKLKINFLESFAYSNVCDLTGIFLLTIFRKMFSKVFDKSKKKFTYRTFELVKTIIRILS